MSKMRAKMQLVSIALLGACEVLRFQAVAKNEAYPADGTDEDNTYAKWSPSASCEITVANPALHGQFKQGEKYYVDFNLAEAVVEPTPAPVIDEVIDAPTEVLAPAAGESIAEDAPLTEAADSHPELGSDATQV